MDNDTLMEGRLPYQKSDGKGKSCMQHVVIGSNRGDCALLMFYVCISIGFQLSEWSKHTTVEDY